MKAKPVDGRRILLCADDYAIAPGVSRGIRELIEAGRMSATSALVTLPEWPDEARAIAQLRSRAAVGLHLNLTLGKPLTAMPLLVQDGSLPSVTSLISRVTGALGQRAAIVEEVCRETIAQLDAFEQALGAPVDFLDGHQHVHALPLVRDGVLRALAERGLRGGLLLRDPGDRMTAISIRGGAFAKASGIALLTKGFRRAAEAAGFITNDGFAGFSAFDEATPYSSELETSFRVPGRRHMVMCHPGYSDATLAERDPVTRRREQELGTLLETPDLTERIIQVRRAAAGDAIDWLALWRGPP